MALVRWDPFRELDEWRSPFEDWFNNFGPKMAVSAPTADVYTENDKELKVEVHLPNFSKEEVDVDVDQGVLQIRAEHKEKDEDKKNRRYVVRESSAQYYRRIGLPKNVDDKKIKADFKDGVLKVTVPFKELPKPKKIAIETPKK